MVTVMNRGGTETLIMNYYREIDKTKVQFDFLTHRTDKGDYDDEILAMGGKIYHMCPIYPQNFIKYKKMIREFFIKHSEYKIIHSHMSELGYFALREAKRQGIPVRICHAHSRPNTFDLKLIVRSYFKIMMEPYINYRFVCSNNSGDWLFGKKYHSEFVHMRNAIDSEKFTFSFDKSLYMRQKLGLENQFVIGHVGRFSKEKNQLFLIEIFNDIKNKNENSKLILIGEGVLEKQIKDRIKLLKLEDDVIFTGSVPNIYDYMQCMDSFILPSLFEGFGNVLIEAQAAGLKCYTSDKVVPKDVKITDLLRFVPLEKSASYWAKLIIENKKGNRGNTCKQILDSGYDIKENSKWLEEFYTNAIKKM
ncbi:hypothetical protein A7L45_18695 [Clostridium estertheticum subsp. estertheticum]|uniref:Glycosyltransferase family 1 protein n=2 Tax=Clostridium estertheticum TaxID=238834 RepID=A0A1J0GKN2_9CLOT|nr:hypothetical protein A7L45_18695 [Clostridium estertheticum subsp. estertheticum]